MMRVRVAYDRVKQICTKANMYQSKYVPVGSPMLVESRSSKLAGEVCSKLVDIAALEELACESSTPTHQFTSSARNDGS